MEIDAKVEVRAPGSHMLILLVRKGILGVQGVFFHWKMSLVQGKRTFLMKIQTGVGKFCFPEKLA